MAIDRYKMMAFYAYKEDIPKIKKIAELENRPVSEIFRGLMKAKIRMFEERTGKRLEA